MANAKSESAKQNKFQKFLGFFKRLGLGIGRAFKNSYYELKKVTWPTRRELITYSLVTVAFMVSMGIVIYLIDLGSGELVKLLLSIG
jgi:preprotein translocase subunit SecE